MNLPGKLSKMGKQAKTADHQTSRKGPNVLPPPKQCIGYGPFFCCAPSPKPVLNTDK